VPSRDGVTQHQVKSFKLSPIFSFGRKHISYNTDGLRELLLSAKLIQSKGNDLAKFRDNSHEYWYPYFDLAKFENSTKTRRFAYSFSTDGTNVSIRMVRDVKKPRKIKRMEII
jgi:hypothetical protein